jgi:hypothetical protein
MNDAARNGGNSESGPVTVVIRRRIKSGFAQAYEALEKEISTDAAAHAGYLGSTFLRPEGGSDQDFVTIVRFDSYGSMMQWENSAAGKALIDRADAMSETPAEFLINKTRTVKRVSFNLHLARTARSYIRLAGPDR